MKITKQIILRAERVAVRKNLQTYTRKTAEAMRVLRAAEQEASVFFDAWKAAQKKVQSLNRDVREARSSQVHFADLFQRVTPVGARERTLLLSFDDRPAQKIPVGNALPNDLETLLLRGWVDAVLRTTTTLTFLRTEKGDAQAALLRPRLPTVAKASPPKASTKARREGSPRG